MIQLLVLPPFEPVRQVPLGLPRLTIGRSLSADIPLFDPYVSHAHALVYRDGSSYWLVDLRSTNGTYLNGRRLSCRHPMSLYDQIAVGETVLVMTDREEFDETAILPQLAVPEAITPPHPTPQLPDADRSWTAHTPRLR